ncbi:MAG: GLPGLI family protein, partial [Saprospiraceae bacterium]
MKNNPISIIVLLLSLVLPTCLFAQYAKLRLEYQCTTKIGNKNFAGKNTLYCNEDEGLYVHNDWPLKDSISFNDNVADVTTGDAEGMPIFMNLKDSLVDYKTDWLSRSNNFFIITEKLQPILWKIDNQQKKIGQYTCLHAIGSFAGRVYDAWFTLDIPISLGPYKLWGLPGLILSAHSQDGYVKYDLRRVTKLLQNEFILEKPKTGRYVTRDEYKEITINRL